MYRRLSAAGVIRVRLSNEPDWAIWLRDKYQVASFQDVFLDPNYWRAFQIFDEDPKLVVDCGAHCGHFAILLDICLRARFGVSRTEYILIEPNEALHRALELNIASANMRDRVTLLTGLVGRKDGRAMFATNAKNFLVSHIGDGGGRGKMIEYLDLAELTAGRPIDLLKLDIEGAEFEFAEANQDVLSVTRNAVVEVHHQAGTFEEFARALERSGLFQSGPILTGRDNEMTWFQQRRTTEDDQPVLAEARI
ncbi:hypothetical protein ASD39_08955 [Sphingomonas sp. Root50]|nr:hypothetical protein ASD39_08955 [Sphingomonas sp. Root50]KRB90641.1 hypothetical protein ASE22_09965 [Sphingomonas sp. Root720]